MNTQLQLCSFEQAKRLKDAGFDWETNEYFDENGDFHFSVEPTNFNGRTWASHILCPTIALALQWFREVHGCHIFIYSDHFTNAIDEPFILYSPVINVLSNYKVISSEVLKGNSNYNQAESAALDAALDWLQKERSK